MSVIHTYGECTRGYAAELWRLLQILGGYERPLYRGTNWVVDGVHHGVHCKIMIYARNNAIASHPRIVMLRLCNAHHAELEGTIFRLHPYTRH